MEMPLSEDALRFARRLAAAKYTYPDDRIAVADLLERWNLGLGATLAERRMALRLSREAALSDQDASAQEAVATLPSVARVLATAGPAAGRGSRGCRGSRSRGHAESGDDDCEDDLDADADPIFTPTPWKTRDGAPVHEPYRPASGIGTGRL